jgi:hypothetical protein
MAAISWIAWVINKMIGIIGCSTNNASRSKMLTFDGDASSFPKASPFVLQPLKLHHTHRTFISLAL